MFHVNQLEHAFSDYTGSTSVSIIPIPAIGPSGSQHWLRPGIPWHHLENVESMSLAVDASSSLIIEVDPADETSIIFRRPTPAGDVLPMYFSGSGKVGINTIDPKTQFDVKSESDDAEGTKLILRSSRTTTPLQAGDKAGEINFAVESGSFAKLETSGSIASLRAEVINASSVGASGKFILNISRDVTDPSYDISTWQYAALGKAGFGQVYTGSIYLEDFSGAIRSRFQMLKARTVQFSVESGSVLATGTGSFGLIEGGTF